MLDALFMEDDTPCDWMQSFAKRRLILVFLKVSGQGNSWHCWMRSTIPSEAKCFEFQGDAMLDVVILEDDVPHFWMQSCFKKNVKVIGKQ